MWALLVGDSCCVAAVSRVMPTTTLTNHCAYFCSWGESDWSVTLDMSRVRALLSEESHHWRKIKQLDLILLRIKSWELMKFCDFLAWAGSLWRSEDGYVEAVLSFHLYVAPWMNPGRQVFVLYDISFTHWTISPTDNQSFKHSICFTVKCELVDYPLWDLDSPSVILLPPRDSWQLKHMLQCRLTAWLAAWWVGFHVFWFWFLCFMRQLAM